MPELKRTAGEASGESERLDMTEKGGGEVGMIEVWVSLVGLWPGGF